MRTLKRWGQSDKFKPWILWLTAEKSEEVMSKYHTSCPNIGFLLSSTLRRRSIQRRQVENAGQRFRQRRRPSFGRLEDAIAHALKRRSRPLLEASTWLAELCRQKRFPGCRRAGWRLTCG